MTDDLELPDGFSEVPPDSDWFGYTSDTEKIEKRYRLSADQYHRMLTEQDGRCAICGRHPLPDGPLHVDHDDDHPEKAVRGLLCRACNTALRLFKHDPYLLNDARKYLLERGCAATRHAEQVERQVLARETAEGTTRLELHFLDGDFAIAAIRAKPRLVLNGQTFDKYGREWRVSDRSRYRRTTATGRKRSSATRSAPRDRWPQEARYLVAPGRRRLEDPGFLEGCKAVRTDSELLEEPVGLVESMCARLRM